VHRHRRGAAGGRRRGRAWQSPASTADAGAQAVVIAALVPPVEFWVEPLMTTATHEKCVCAGTVCITKLPMTWRPGSESKSDGSLVRIRPHPEYFGGDITRFFLLEYTPVLAGYFGASLIPIPPTHLPCTPRFKRRLLPLQLQRRSCRRPLSPPLFSINVVAPCGSDRRRRTAASPGRPRSAPATRPRSARPFPEALGRGKSRRIREPAADSETDCAVPNDAGSATISSRAHQEETVQCAPRPPQGGERHTPYFYL